MPADPASFGGATDYEAFLAGGDPDTPWAPPADEWQAIALNYTSGTTGDPKGVVYHHRGAYLAAISNLLEWDMPKHAVYLWTLPMFHCNGWCFPWTVAARAGVNVCLRKFDPRTVFDLIRGARASPTTAARPSCTARWPTCAGRVARRHRPPGACHGGGRRARAGGDRQDEGDRLRPDACLRPDRGLRPGHRLRHAAALGRTARGGTRAAHRAPGRALPDLQAGATVLDPDTMASRCRPTARRSARSCSAATSA